MNSEKYQYKCQPVDLNLINEYMFHNKWKRATCLFVQQHEARARPPGFKARCPRISTQGVGMGRKTTLSRKKMFRNKKSN